MTASSDLEDLLTHAEWLGRLARRLVADASTADDLVQETWMAALRRPPDPDRPAQPWLATVVRRLAALRSRREAVRSRDRQGSDGPAVGPQGGAEEAADEVVARVELERALADQVLALEEPYRNVVLLRYYRGMSAPQISRELGVPSATVRTRLKRGLERLRARLDRTNGGDGRSWMAALAPLCTNTSAPTTSALMIGGGLVMKALVGVALVATVFVVAWPRKQDLNTPAAAEPEALAPAQVVDASPAEPSPVERPAESAARIEIPPEVAVSPGASIEETGLIVRAVRRDDGEAIPEVSGYLRLAGPGGGHHITWPEGDRHARLLEQAEADAAGILRFDLPYGKRLVLHLSGAAREVGWLELPIAQLAEGELREVLAEIPVGPDLHFLGRLVDDSTNEPLGAIQVAVPEGQSTGGVVGNYITTTTDPDGYFVIDGLSWERQHLEVDAPGYGRLLAVLVAGHDSRETSQELRLQKAATLDVHVAGRGGVPIVAEVRATTGFSGLIRPRTGVGDTTGFNPRWSVTTGSDGRATMAGLPPGVPIALELWRDGQLARRVAEAPRMSPGETRTLKLSLGDGARILGEARDPSGAAVADLPVLLRAAGRERRDRYFGRGDTAVAEQQVITDVEGRFVFEDVPPGAWLIGPASQAGPFDASHAPPLATYVRIEEDAIEERVILEIAPGLAIHGLVVDAAGIPRAGLWVRLSCESLDGIQDFLTGEDGRFVAGPLAPGRFQLVAHGRGDTADSAPTWALAGVEEEILLTLAPAAEIRGRIIDHETGEGRAADLRLIAADEPTGYVRWNRSSREGDFHQESLEPGTYHLLARSDDGGIALLRDLVIEGSTSLEGIEVRLMPGAILVVSDPQATEDRSFSLMHDDLHAGHGFVGPAKISEQVLHPGVTTVYYRGGVGKLDVDLTPGERRELILPPLGSDDR